MTVIQLTSYLAFALALFVIGCCGLVTWRRHLLLTLICLEMLLLAVNINFVTFSYYWGDINGQIMVFFILAVAAAKAAIALAISVVLYRQVGSIAIADLDNL